MPRGVVACLTHRAAATPTAAPCCPPLPMNLVVVPAIRLTLMCLPAIIRFEMLVEYRQRNGMP